ncbi:N-acetyltransferase GCN5 [Halolamina sp.]|uniref:N-acetyltransferase GCN5 n=1 Tax=Halolamina sp. TaxID=1940283 RepID=UPI000223BD07|nr:GCN5-related N-acetyltransferase [halophilic archaeon DL31]
MTLSPSAQRAIRRDWAERFGCNPVAFEQRGVTLVDGGPDRSIRLFRRGDATVVAADREVREALESCDAAVQRWPLVDAIGLLGLSLGVPADEVGRAHGPAVLAYVDAGSFTPVKSSARLLKETDAEAFDGLRSRTSAKEWARASPTFRLGRTAGLFRDDELVAVATLGAGPLPDVGVVVAGEARNEGFGRAVVSRVLEAGFQEDGAIVPRYRTPESASASLSLAAAVGFERWASEVVVVRE